MTTMFDLVPFEADGLLRRLDQLFDTPSRRAGWLPRVDIIDRGDRFVVRAELAGVDVADVDVTVEGRSLTISGERRFEMAEGNGGYRHREIVEGEFRRTLTLPDGIAVDEVKAEARNGVLEITVPRVPEVLPRKITVDVTG